METASCPQIKNAGHTKVHIENKIGCIPVHYVFFMAVYLSRYIFGALHDLV